MIEVGDCIGDSHGFRQGVTIRAKNFRDIRKITGSSSQTSMEDRIVEAFDRARRAPATAQKEIRISYEEGKLVERHLYMKRIFSLNGRPFIVGKYLLSSSAKRWFPNSSGRQNL
jgi:hypothetical protein